MSLSAKSLHASGRISDRQMSKLQVLRGTTAQKSKMAAFDGKKRDEGAKGNRGIPEVCDYEIDKPSVQSRSNMTKGSKAGAESSPIKRKQIDTNKGPKFPAGGDVKASNPKSPPARKGRIQRAGVVYNEPGRN